MSVDDEDRQSVIEIPLDRIQVDPNQPRKVFDEGKLRELAESIQKFGLIEPIIVFRVPNQTYLFQIEEGERRFRACALLELPSIKAIIVPLKKSRREIQNRRLAENLDREPLSDSELALEFKARVDNGQSREQIAKDVGRSRAFVSQRLLILEHPDVFEAMQKGELTFAQARDKLKPKTKAHDSPDFTEVLKMLEVPRLFKDSFPTDINRVYDAYTGDLVKLRKVV